MVKKKASRTPGIGLIGANAEARRIAFGYISGGYDIESVWDPDVSAAEALAGKLGARSCADLDELLGDKKIKAVEVVTPLERRCKDAISAAKAGKHISVRAPVSRVVENSTTNSTTLENILQGCRIFYRYLDPLHHHAPHALARKLALNEEIGYLNGIRIKVAAGDVSQFDSDGLNEPLDRLTLARWITGDVEECETYRSPASSVTVLKFADEHRFGNFEAVLSPGLIVPFAQRPWDESIEISGTSGIIWVNGFWGPIADRPPVVMRRYKRMISFGADVMVDPIAAYMRAAKVFVRGIEDGGRGFTGIDYAVADLKLLIAANRSAENGGRARPE